MSINSINNNITFLSQKLLNSIPAQSVSIRTVVKLNANNIVNITLHSQHFYRVLKYLYTTIYQLGHYKVSFADLAFIFKCAAYARLYRKDNISLCMNINSILEATGLFPGMVKLLSILPVDRLVYIANIAIIRFNFCENMVSEITDNSEYTLIKLSNCIAQQLPHFTKAKLEMEKFTANFAATPVTFSMFYEQPSFSLFDGKLGSNSVTPVNHVDTDIDLFDEECVNYSTFKDVFISSPTLNLTSTGTLFSLLYIPTTTDICVNDLKQFCCSQAKIINYTVSDSFIDLTQAVRHFINITPTGGSKPSERKSNPGQKSKPKKETNVSKSNSSKPKEQEVNEVEHNKTNMSIIVNKFSQLLRFLINEKLISNLQLNSIISGQPNESYYDLDLET